MKSQTEIESAVDIVLMKLMGINAADVTNASREKTPGWSSLMHIEIFFSLEEEFGIRFDDNALAFSDSRNDLVKIVLAAIAE